MGSRAVLVLREVTIAVSIVAMSALLYASAKARRQSPGPELLDQVGTTLRVPTPLTDAALQAPPATSADDAGSMTQATARLRQTRAELRDHQWEPCIATCRQVLENVRRLVILPSRRGVTAYPPSSAPRMNAELPSSTNY